MKRLALLIAVSVGFLGASVFAEQAAAPRPLAGRPLADALRDLQARGIRVVFSSELVRPSMRVAAEPAGAGAREILDDLLKPHGLQPRPGPDGTFIVVRAGARAAVPAGAATAPATIKGVVVDARLATPLPGVVVRLAADAAAEQVTDADGHFELTNVPPGRHTLFASLVGYSLGRPTIEVGATGVREITITLAAGTATYVEEVTVTADPFRAGDPAIVSAMALNAGDLHDLRGVLADDPLRAVHALPAVTAENDLRAEFAVRGADYRHVGLSVDGMTTDWPIHTVRSDLSAGSVSLINSDVVDSVTVFAGGYPQDRPARTGARVDFTLREGSRARLQTRGALSMTSASLILEGPIGSTPRGSWLLATRQSYVQWIVKRMATDGTAFGYTDIQAKAVYDLTPAQRVDLTVIAGRSQLDLEREGNDDPNLIARGEADAVLVTAGWRAARGAGVTLTQRVSATRYGFENYRLDAVPLSTGAATSFAYRGSASWTLKPSALLQAGVHVQRDRLDQSATRFIELPWQQTTVARPETADATRWMWSADLRASHTLGRGVKLDGGALVSGAEDDARGPAPSPWIGVAAPVGAGFTLRGGGGLYRQHPGLDQTSGTFGHDGVGTERAAHVEAALEHRWQARTRAQVTVFRRTERDMLRLADNDYRLAGGAMVGPSLTPRWVNSIDGTASGIEFVLQRRAATGLTGWVSYGYAHTRHHDRRTGEVFDADFDQRHTFSAYGHYRLSPVTSVSARIRAASNIPMPAYLESRDGGFFLAERRNGVRLRAYQRVDVRADRVFNYDSRRLTLFVEVVNVLGRENHAPTFDSIYVHRDGRVFSTQSRLFPFLPTAGLLFEF